MEIGLFGLNYLIFRWIDTLGVKKLYNDNGDYKGYEHERFHLLPQQFQCTRHILFLGAHGSDTFNGFYIPQGKCVAVIDLNRNVNPEEEIDAIDILYPKIPKVYIDSTNITNPFEPLGYFTNEV